MGGRLKFFIDKWTHITSDPWLLAIVELGFASTFETQPPLSSRPHSMPTSRHHQAVLETVEGLLEKRVIEKVRKISSPGYYSRFFVVPKSTPGKWRAILDLSALNKHIRKEKFKMETAESIRSQLQEGDWVASVDLSDAYHHVLIRKSFRKYLRFSVEGEVYQYRALPMGLTDSARIFTKVVQEVKAFLATRGLTVHQYLDDWLVSGRSPAAVEQQVTELVELTESLGWVINYEKSDLKPTQEFVFLGSLYNLKEGMVYPTQERIGKVQHALKPFRTGQKVAAITWQSAIGILSATEKVVPGGLLKLRPLQVALTELWKAQGENPTAMLQVTPEVSQAAAWWQDPEHITKGVPLHRPEPEVRVYTDASQEGWGGYLEDQQTTVQGEWSQQQAALHINAKELLAIHLVLQKLVSAVTNRRVLVATDSATAASYVNKQGGTHSKTLLAIAQSLLEWAEACNVTIQCRHIPGRLNVVADRLSRARQNLPTEWTLLPTLVNALWLHWEKPMLDLFATRENRQLPVYVSPVPDSNAYAVDALSIPWDNLYAYAFPPTAILLKVLSRLRKMENCTLILIAPLWRRQQFFPLLLELSIDHPLRLKVSKKMLKQPSTQAYHRNPQMFNLHAWKISSSNSKQKDFRRRSQGESPNHKKIPPSWSTRESGGVFAIGASRGATILSKPMW